MGVLFPSLSMNSTRPDRTVSGNGDPSIIGQGGCAIMQPYSGILLDTSEHKHILADNRNLTTYACIMLSLLPLLPLPFSFPIHQDVPHGDKKFRSGGILFWSGRSRPQLNLGLASGFEMLNIFLCQNVPFIFRGLKCVLLYIGSWNVRCWHL